MKKIVLTGGGTAGHVTPNIALMPELKKRGYDISYIGSYEGMEKGMIMETKTPYYGIATGKLRRYFDLKNFTDPFRIIKGYFEARSRLKKIHPDVVFSKGGFVAVPVVRAAHALKIPVIIHESDMTPGLANKLCIPVASKVCCNFPETLKYLPSDKAVLSGSPIRSELFEGDRSRGLHFCGLTSDKPVILIMGGSLGAVAVNEAVRAVLPELLKDFQVIHLCGKGKTCLYHAGRYPPCLHQSRHRRGEKESDHQRERKEDHRLPRGRSCDPVPCAAGYGTGPYDLRDPDRNGGSRLYDAASG